MLLEQLTPRSKALLLLAAKAQASTKRDANHVHAVADAHLKPMTLAAAYAFGMGRKAVDKVALRSATTEKQMHQAMDGAPAAVKRAALKVLMPVLVKCFADGMRASLKTPRFKAAQLRTLAPLNIKFDVSNPAAVKWAEEHAAELAQGLSDTTRDDIAAAIADVLDGNISQDEAYDEILAAVGDPDRAEMIARTETMAAANEGNREGWSEAVDAGLLPEDVRVEWIATSGCCDDCDDLDGETRPVDGEYDNGDAGDGPPLHPNCRCTEGISA